MGAVLLLSTGCVRGDRHEDLTPPPGFAPPPLRSPRGGPRGDRVSFGRGFFPVEWGPDGRTWRWMGARGEIDLPNDGQAHLLRLSGWFPLEFLATPPAIRIALGDGLLDSFDARERRLAREYRISAAQLGLGPSSRLVLETSATALAPNDARALGISIEEVGWR
jgi:hypothetical protein